MRKLALLSLFILPSLSCTLIVRNSPETCKPGPVTCDEDNNLVSCSEGGLTIKTDCGALICNATLATCSSCGNGIVDAGEECDDGNVVDGDECETNCTEPTCGNGITDSVFTVDLDGDGTPDAPEECDNAGDNSDDLPDRCRLNCQQPSCGDDTVDSGEECDDGANNADAAKKCRTNCVLPACGDGIVDFTDLDGDGKFTIGEGEACDDGNDIDDDGCNSTPDTTVPIDPFNAFVCNKTFPGCNNDNAREVNSDGDHELCYDRPQDQVSLGTNPGAQALVARDFDGNAPKNDVIVVKGNIDKVGVFLNDGTPAGKLVFEADFDVNPAATGGAGVGIDPIAIATADFNGDFKADVVTANQGSGNISVLLNQTAAPFNASFSDPVVFPAGTGPVAIAAGDINGDGLQDVVTANPSTNTVNILFGNGTGSFAAAQSQTVGNNKKPVSVVIADIDGDADKDIITANEQGNDVSLLINNGTATAFTVQNVGAGLAPADVAAADMEGDGDVDLVVANSGDDTVSILLSSGAALGFTEKNEDTEQKPTDLFVGDLNHDDQGQTPLLEIIVVNEVSNSITILRAKESAPGTFSPPLVINVGQKPVAIASTDFDFNTYFDIAVVNNGSSNMSVLYFTP